MSDLLIGREPSLTTDQFDRIANIFDNAGQVVLGIVVLSPLIAGFDQTNPIVLTLGILVTIACWIFSVWFSKKRGKL